MKISGQVLGLEQQSIIIIMQNHQEKVCPENGNKHINSFSKHQAA